MDLEGILVESEKIDLPITIEFNEQWELLEGGRLKFGLKGGTLKLNLENGHIPQNLCNLTGLKVLTEEQVTEKFQFPSICEVTTNGSELNLVWLFELKKASSVLKGTLLKEKLGTLTVNNQPCCVEATFEVELKYVHITEVEGLWSEKDSINKQRIAQVRVRKNLCSLLQPYVSRTKLRYG
ncbi:hypothetical protein [Tychonema sp. LEGE 07203]|uniref:hypothetical protein n=1 Tax=Tychonema sp. LEGE 07203 TaxID=1828671 RepID=UPI00187EA42D|nr:hypothetical protein [Tychonema sp. LEGE 07203]MBE9092425.1 hypothetical protein [Tychonema sp. LEGE 07203]